jgi:transcription initiation factor TFIIIB Brf1 subunit/transcription initiation factor TFIIB
MENNVSFTPVNRPVAYACKIKEILESKTVDEYKQVIKRCKEVFEKKTIDYGTAWRILRLPSITDQIFIKAQRIRSIQEKGSQKVPDDVISEFIGIVNYCIIALIQIKLGKESEEEIPVKKIISLYDQAVSQTIDLLLNKNHDYDEAWRDMRVSSMTDIILMKLYRIKQIEDNQGKTIVSEGVRANYQDIMNYAIFCLIKLNFYNEV